MATANELHGRGPIREGRVREANEGPGQGQGDLHLAGTGTPARTHTDLAEPHTVRSRPKGESTMPHKGGLQPIFL
jgi:hypothetical protein